MRVVIRWNILRILRLSNVVAPVTLVPGKYSMTSSFSVHSSGYTFGVVTQATSAKSVAKRSALAASSR
jgi:hypothetical protein